VVHGDAALREQLFDVSVGQPIAQVQAHCKLDHLARKPVASQRDDDNDGLEMLTPQSRGSPDLPTQQRQDGWCPMSDDSPEWTAAVLASAAVERAGVRQSELGRYAPLSHPDIHRSGRLTGETRWLPPSVSWLTLGGDIELSATLGPRVLQLAEANYHPIGST
jgi:hypothetical protein